MCGLFRWKWKPVVVLDSELFSCRYTQTQYYTLTTPTGSCGSKNERPNNTHLNLGGTQMSPVFLELNQVPLHLPLKLCKSLFCVFIVLFTILYGMPELWSPKSLRHGGDRASGTLWTNTKTPACLHSFWYTIYLPWCIRWDCHKSSRRQARGRFSTVVRIRCYLVLARSLTRVSLPTTSCTTKVRTCTLKTHMQYMHQLVCAVDVFSLLVK